MPEDTFICRVSLLDNILDTRTVYPRQDVSSEIAQHNASHRALDADVGVKASCCASSSVRVPSLRAFFFDRRPKTVLPFTF